MTDKIIQYAMACLTDTQRRRYALRLHGMSYSDIAEREGVSIKCVWTSVFLSKRKVKREISHLGGVKKG